MEEALQKEIKERSLPAGSTWEDVSNAYSAAALQEAIKEKGLPAGSTWEDVSNAYSAAANKDPLKEAYEQFIKEGTAGIGGGNPPDARPPEDKGKER